MEKLIFVLISISEMYYIFFTVILTILLIIILSTFIIIILFGYIINHCIYKNKRLYILYNKLTIFNKGKIK